LFYAKLGGTSAELIDVHGIGNELVDICSCSVVYLPPNEMSDKMLLKWRTYFKQCMRIFWYEELSSWKQWHSLMWN